MIIKKTKSLLKACLFLGLATLTVNAFSWAGSPLRPYTVWIPPHCHNGCSIPGYYVQFQSSCLQYCKDLWWVNGHCDHCGNYIPGHYGFVGGPKV